MGCCGGKLTFLAISQRKKVSSSVFLGLFASGTIDRLASLLLDRPGLLDHQLCHWQNGVDGRKSCCRLFRVFFVEGADQLL